MSYGQRELNREWLVQKDLAPFAPAPAMLAIIGQLYEVEQQARPLAVEERYALRQPESVPVFDRIEAWLEERALSALPKNVFGQAIGYARNQWEALRRYTYASRHRSRAGWRFLAA